MIKSLFFTAIIMFSLGNFTPVLAQKGAKSNSYTQKSGLKFINDIEIGLEPVREVLLKDAPLTNVEPNFTEPGKAFFAEEPSIEMASSLQLKYSLLLNTEVETIKNLSLFRLIDEWFGTRYRYGGSTKSGVDCSAFVQIMYAGLFGLALPRTAREQYTLTKKISRTEIKEGDLVFFDTRGGVSHVGIYLQNNKFVHAASSGGVMISDLYDNYWAQRFIGVGRYEKADDALFQIQP